MIVARSSLERAEPGANWEVSQAPRDFRVYLTPSRSIAKRAADGWRAYSEWRRRFWQLSPFGPLTRRMGLVGMLLMVGIVDEMPMARRNATVRATPEKGSQRAPRGICSWRRSPDNGVHRPSSRSYRKFRQAGFERLVMLGQVLTVDRGGDDELLSGSLPRNRNPSHSWDEILKTVSLRGPADPLLSTGGALFINGFRVGASSTGIGRRRAV